eukprot:scaffold13034_cov119-Cylindrotheca_fusiformis.AAC.1
MSEPWDELEARRAEDLDLGERNQDYSSSTSTDASGNSTELDFGSMKKKGERYSISTPLPISPYASTASSIASTSGDDMSIKSASGLDNMKYALLGLLQERKWRLALVSFVFALMVLIAVLAGTAASREDQSSSSFSRLFTSPESSPSKSPDEFEPTSVPSVSPTTGTPTLQPSESPSNMPSIWVQKVSDPFQLRLYWESGYYWQESIYETFFCAECVKCDRYSVQDGASANCSRVGKSSASCQEGNMLWLHNCKETSRKFQFEIVTNRAGDQIRVAGTSLCFSTVSKRFIELRPCDNSDLKQLWNPISSLKKFEIRPYTQRFLPTDEARCASQSHHPKNEEIVALHSCASNLNATTNYWQEFH